MAELGAHGEVKTISTEPIQGSFSASFTLTVDHSNDYAFVSQAEDNRAKVFAVSGTPPKRWSLWKSPSGAIGTLAPWRRTA